MKRAWFAPVAPGLEAVLARELVELGLKPSRETGGCTVHGPARIGWTIAAQSRIAAGILVRIGQVRASSPAQVTGGVRKLDWAPFVHARQRVSVRLTGGGRRFRKDALEAAIRRGVEQSLRGPRREMGRRPRSDVTILARLQGDSIALSIDAAGERLHRRGWRKATAKAPLRENLAAAVLRLADWRPDEWLVDPMCGSGTFPIEAGQIALGIWPGARRSFAFEEWPSHDASAWRSFLRESRRAGRHAGVLGADRDAGAIRAARANLERSGAKKAVTLRNVDLRELDPPAGAGLLVCNPPWGLRVGGDSARGAWTALGGALRGPFEGWRVALVGPSPDLARATGVSLQHVASFPAGGQRLGVWIGGRRGQSPDG